MERTLRLRSSQLWGKLRLSFLVTLILTIMGLVSNYFMTNDFSELLVTSKIIENVGQFIWMVIVFFIFGSCLSDGLEDFDSALRFGINRLHYFINNLVLILFFSIVDMIGQVIGTHGPMFIHGDLLPKGFTIQSFIISFASFMIITLLGYLYYRFGSKILFVAFAIPFVGGVVTAMFANDFEPKNALVLKLVDIIGWMLNNWLICAVGFTILMIVAYYRLVMKTEIR